MSCPDWSCTETFRRLDDYVDRELSADELEAVEAHLARCAECAGEFGAEREILAAIRAKLAHLAVPQDLRAKISALLDRE
jgi:anti-sigma factor (TIGR02949 family)